MAQRASDLETAGGIWPLDWYGFSNRLIHHRYFLLLPIEEAPGQMRNTPS